MNLGDFVRPENVDKLISSLFDGRIAIQSNGRVVLYL